MGIIKSIFEVSREIKKAKTLAKKYNNMSLQQLKALSEEELEEAVNAVLYYNADSEETDRYNAAQLTVITVKAFDSEVQNGGLCQFFVNSSRNYAPFLVDSLHSIGAHRTADLYQKFVEDNHINVNDLSFFAISSLDEFEEKNKMAPFDDFDEIYYECYENIDGRLMQYVRNHLGEVFEGSI